MILVMGVTGAGKSYFINQLAGQNVVQEGHTLSACTCTQKSQLVPAEVGHSKVLLVDTPGFDDPVRTDSEILNEIADVLATQYKLGVKLKGIVYLHRITDIRYTGASIKTFEICKMITGVDALKNVILATTRWDDLDDAVGSDREHQLRENFWAYMLGHGSKMSRFYGDRGSAVSLLSQLLSSEPVVLELQRELVQEGKTLDQTTAGSFVEHNLDQLKARYEKQMADLEHLKQELRANDWKMKKQIQRDWEAEQTRLAAVRKEKEQLQRPVDQEIEQQIKQKKSRTRKVLGFLPQAIGILAGLAGIPTGLLPLLLSWFQDTNSEFDPSSFSDLLAL
ncbi:P-loop containing nucleoside triphosphate hydrolase protein [Corynespora cassiicola Philippines]|uniref:P-loop containing nucleoside triphosphate hydrolase protein n=1 Tax=Corynespora cassiicola Philippines TaxID=1448308 RepID=A0A2T2N613_CORCC|nr:P-loop containing nucleoside triphosphate hydrolase protein [Corynespora cassiicola Philippines]